MSQSSSLSYLPIQMVAVVIESVTCVSPDVEQDVRPTRLHPFGRGLADCAVVKVIPETCG